MRLVLAGAPPFAWLPRSVLEPVFLLLHASLVVNLVLATFNLIPVPPLDGSWILSNYLSGRAERMYRSLQPYGFLILVALMYSGVLWSVLRPVVQFGRMLALQ